MEWYLDRHWRCSSSSTSLWPYKIFRGSSGSQSNLRVPELLSFMPALCRKLLEATVDDALSAWWHYTYGPVKYTTQKKICSRIILRHVPPQGLLALVHGRGHGTRSVSFCWQCGWTPQLVALYKVLHVAVSLPCLYSGIVRSRNNSIQNVCCRHLG